MTPALSPLDDRYASVVAPLLVYFSEFAFFRYRLRVEVEWLLLMSQEPALHYIRDVSREEQQELKSIVSAFEESDMRRIKELEAETNHDVKALERYLRERLLATSMRDLSCYVHYCCTGDDINNLAYALMLRDAIHNVWMKAAGELVETVRALAIANRDVPMLGRTHGQPAAPTTVGKELAVFVHRWERQLEQIKARTFLGKFNGAVGNYNAHMVALPQGPWEALSQAMITRLGLEPNPVTTQIEPHDYIAELFHNLNRFNTITVDFDRDMWSYIAADYFSQTHRAGETGSSAMPHKVNPIEFENSEANMSLSSALCAHLADQLMTSRLQRDLTDSTLLRNCGVAVGHSLLGLKSTLSGVLKVRVNEERLRADLRQHWEILAEAVQTVLRRAGRDNASEIVRDFVRGRVVTKEEFQGFILSLGLQSEDATQLLALTPETYIGLASKIVSHIVRR